MEMYTRTEEQKMDRWETGMLAKSLVGHDKDKVYVIVGLDEQFTYLADGERKTLQSPKKKKKKQKISVSNGILNYPVLRGSL